MTDTIVDKEITLLRVAIAVFDAYVHGFTLPSLATETANCIDTYSRAHARSVRTIGTGMLMSRAAAELRNMAMHDLPTIHDALTLRDYFKAMIEGKQS